MEMKNSTVEVKHFIMEMKNPTVKVKHLTVEVKYHIFENRTVVTDIYITNDITGEGPTT